MSPADPADRERDSHFADSGTPCPECGREYHALGSGFINRPGSIEIAGVESVCFIPADFESETPAGMYFHLPHHEVVEVEGDAESGGEPDE